MSQFVHIDNKKKDINKNILIIGKRQTQELNDTSLTAETQY